MKIEQDYLFGQSKLRVCFGSIVNSRTEVIVNSDDSMLSMKGGSSKAILEAAGHSVFDATRLLVPIEPGRVRPSDPGNLATQGVKYIFHAVVRVDGAPRNLDIGEDIVASAVEASLELMKSMGLRSIAMPALGTGYAGYDPLRIARAMIKPISRILRQTSEAFHVEIRLLIGAGRDREAIEFLGELTRLAELSDVAVKSHAVLLVHGIRTRAGWSGRVQEELQNASPKLTPMLIGYGFFDVVRFLLPLRKWRAQAAETVWKKSQAVFANENFDKVSIIAHSFGSWIVTYLLMRKKIRVYRLILCGCVVDANFDWNEEVTAKIVGPPLTGTVLRKVLNDVGTRDIWPLLAQAATWGFGSSGRCGFQHPLVEDRCHAVDHSGFFEPGFAVTSWAPVLLDESLPSGTDFMRDPGYIWNILSLVKIPVLAILGILVWGILKS
ncbi:MAG: hypothetical protein CVV06_05120 [Gammaproteobacteria bacterium HGW-Gammaproteobacteria-10]|nr:MAG: hypothetical protein CVV06_05120 [Gammaproteobacteria bacterium HGW-Gammaproteobacteria-10]